MSAEQLLPDFESRELPNGVDGFRFQARFLRLCRRGLRPKRQPRRELSEEEVTSKDMAMCEASSKDAHGRADAAHRKVELLNAKVRACVRACAAAAPSIALRAREEGGKRATPRRAAASFATATPTPTPPRPLPDPPSTTQHTTKGGRRDAQGCRRAAGLGGGAR